MTTSTTVRSVSMVLQGQPASDGAGVKLLRVFDPRRARELDPFLLFDEFRSDEASDYVAGFPPHPHRGFETVTYMIEGRMRHKDNHGNEGDLGPGGVQWMSAARGIVHEERPQQDRGLMWGYQLWVNLPKRDKMAAPWYDDIQQDRIGTVALEGGGSARVIAGSFGGVTGPVRPRPAEPTYLDIELPAHAQVRVEVPSGHTVLVHGVTGDVEVGAERRPLAARQCALLTRDGAVLVATGAGPGRVLLLGGKPFGEPIAHYGPFVMNTHDELRAAVDDFQNGRF